VVRSREREHGGEGEHELALAESRLVCVFGLGRKHERENDGGERASVTTRSGSIVPSRRPGPAARGTNAASATSPRATFRFEATTVRFGAPSSGSSVSSASRPSRNTAANAGRPSSPNTPSSSQPSASAP
jgi:hypothetical protein